MQLTNFQIAELLQGEIPVILKEQVSFKLKYLLTKLSHNLESHFKIFNSLKEEIVKKYGTPDSSGMIYIKNDSEEYVNILKELSPIGEESVEIDVQKIPLSLFDGVNSNYNFPILFLILDEEK